MLTIDFHRLRARYQFPESQNWVSAVKKRLTWVHKRPWPKLHSFRCQNSTTRNRISRLPKIKKKWNSTINKIIPTQFHWKKIINETVGHGLDFAKWSPTLSRVTLAPKFVTGYFFLSQVTFLEILRVLKIFTGYFWKFSRVTQNFNGLLNKVPRKR